ARSHGEGGGEISDIGCLGVHGIAVRRWAQRQSRSASSLRAGGCCEAKPSSQLTPVLKRHALRLETAVDSDVGEVAVGVIDRKGGQGVETMVDPAPKRVDIRLNSAGITWKSLD